LAVKTTNPVEVFLTDTVLLTCGQVCRRATRDQRRDLITLVGMLTVNSPDNTLKVDRTQRLHYVFSSCMECSPPSAFISHSNDQ